MTHTKFLVLGPALAVLILAAVLSGCSDDKPNCDIDDPNPDALSASAFQEQDETLKDIVDTLNSGDRAAAEEAYFGPVSDYAYQVHAVLEEEDEDAAQELCSWIKQVEESVENDGSDHSLTVRIDRVRAELRDAAVALGYPRPRQQ